MQIKKADIDGNKNDVYDAEFKANKEIQLEVIKIESDFIPGPVEDGRKETHERVFERRMLAMKLRVLGLSYDEIGVKTGTTRYVAFNDVKIMMRQRQKERMELADTLIELEDARLDFVSKAITKQVADGNLKAVDRYLAVSKRRCEMLGLDQPKRIDVGASLQDGWSGVLKEFGIEPNNNETADQ